MVVEAKVSAWIRWDGLPVRHQYQSNHGEEDTGNGDDAAVQFESLHQQPVEKIKKQSNL